MLYWPYVSTPSKVAPGTEVGAPNADRPEHAREEGGISGGTRCGMQALTSMRSATDAALLTVPQNSALLYAEPSAPVPPPPPPPSCCPPSSLSSPPSAPRMECAFFVFFLRFFLSSSFLLSFRVVRRRLSLCVPAPQPQPESQCVSHPPLVTDGGTIRKCIDT